MKTKTKQNKNKSSYAKVTFCVCFTLRNNPFYCNVFTKTFEV